MICIAVTIHIKRIEDRILQCNRNNPIDAHLSDHEIIFLNTSVTAVIAGVEVPWPGFDNDGCANLIEGESCPLPSGSPSTWEYDVDVLAEYPVVSILIL